MSTKVNCSAHGCPMIGSMSRSTVGTDEYLCNIHFFAASSQWQKITYRLNINKFLVEAINLIRARRDYREIQRLLIDNDRRDLLREKDESAQKWLYRLDSVLSAMVTERDAPADTQMQLEASDTWQKVSVSRELVTV